MPFSRIELPASGQESRLIAVADPLRTGLDADSEQCLRAVASKVSVVIPVYRSESSLEPLTRRLLDVSEVMGREFEIIFVDDRSPDGSWAVLQRLKARHPRIVKIARLHRNSGQHNALLCGFYLAGGDTVVTMDDDLQNPPEEIPHLVAAVEQGGYDLAVGAYGRKEHSAARNASGGVVDTVLRRIFALPPNFQLTSFRAVRGEVVRSAREMSGVFPYVAAMLLSHCANQVNVPVRHEPRHFGRSNYTLRRSFTLAANLIFNYSSYPVYAVGALCLAAFVMALGLGVTVFLRALIVGSAVPGWASIVVAVSVLNGMTLLSLFIFGIYLSRLNAQITRTKSRFTISEQIL